VGEQVEVCSIEASLGDSFLVAVVVICVI